METKDKRRAGFEEKQRESHYSQSLTGKEAV
jgi:hypothetical protein